MYEWCTDNGLTPYIAVRVDESVQVPYEFVQNNEIVLNISMQATGGLQLGNEWIEFKARFSGVSQSLMIPISHVLAIYAQENSQGMQFPDVPSDQNTAIHPSQNQALDTLSTIGASPLYEPVQDTAGKGLKLIRPLENMASFNPLDLSALEENTERNSDMPPEPPPPTKRPPSGHPSLKRVK